MPKCFRFRHTYTDDRGTQQRPEFRCLLSSRQCSAQTSRTQERCRNNVVMGLPFCYAHTPTELNVMIKPSTRNGRDGKGVFAHNPRINAGRVFEAGEQVLTLKGQLRSTEQMIRRYGDIEESNQPYGIQISAQRWIDGACLRGIGMMINHAPASRSNVGLWPVTQRGSNRVVIIIRAVKNINQGTELLMDWSIFQRKPWLGQQTHRTYDCAGTNTWLRGYINK
jgi:hypothetical protein